MLFRNPHQAFFLYSLLQEVFFFFNGMVGQWYHDGVGTFLVSVDFEPVTHIYLTQPDGLCRKDILKWPESIVTHPASIQFIQARWNL